MLWQTWRVVFVFKTVDIPKSSLKIGTMKVVLYSFTIRLADFFDIFLFRFGASSMPCVQSEFYAPVKHF